MTRTLSSALQTHIAGEVTSIATLWKITRQDGAVLAFTDHDSDITYDSVTYAATSGFFPTTIAQKDDLSVDNMDVDFILSSGNITEADIEARLYDGASIQISMINHESVSDGVILILDGTIGRFEITKGMGRAEIRSKAQAIEQSVGRLYGATCDAVLGDSRCGVNLASFTVSGTVTTVEDNRVFSDTSLNQANGYFTLGEIEWTSGSNNGLKMEIKGFVNSEVQLSLPMPYTIQVGDTFDVIAGCNKRKTTCLTKFSNLVNFRGFADIPGTDKLYQTSTTFNRSDNY